MRWWRGWRPWPGKSCERAFCFIGAGGHHAGYRQFWGACCFNDVVIALTHTREISPWRRFAIVDTDAHHGDGTRQLVRDDPTVFHLCFCAVNFIKAMTAPRWMSMPTASIPTPRGPRRPVRRDGAAKTSPCSRPFKPDLLIWYYGFDTHRDDYGSLGLAEAAYFAICDLMLAAADHLAVPLLVVLAGGSMSHLATATIPENHPPPGRGLAPGLTDLTK